MPRAIGNKGAVGPCLLRPEPTNTELQSPSHRSCLHLSAAGKSMLQACAGEKTPPTHTQQRVKKSWWVKQKPHPTTSEELVVGQVRSRRKASIPFAIVLGNNQGLLAVPRPPSAAFCTPGSGCTGTMSQPIDCQFSSVQFKMVSMRSGRPMCAPRRLSGASPMLP